MAVFVAVPIAAFHKDHRAPLWQHDIRTPLQVFAMMAEPEAKPAEQATQDDLRLSFFSPNTPHHGTAFFSGNDVCHRLA